MNCLMDENGDILISPGDIVDKLTILKIKDTNIRILKNKIDCKENQEKEEEKKNKWYCLDGKLLLIKKDIKQTSQILKELIYLKLDIVKICRFVAIMKDLEEINQRQWTLENKVRNEKSWESAKAARDNNEARVEAKNKINCLFQYPYEQKEYVNNEL